MRLIDFKVLTFDCYGTLIDWESGMVAALKPLTDRVQRPLSRNEILETHARHESMQQRFTPAKIYSDLLPVVYKRLADEWGVTVSWDECVAYGLSVGDWPAFADSAALAYESRRPASSHYVSAAARRPGQVAIRRQAPGARRCFRANRHPCASASVNTMLPAVVVGL